MKKILKILIAIIILFLIGGLVWYFVGVFKKLQFLTAFPGWEVPGYSKEVLKAEKDNLEVFYTPEEHQEKNLERVVGNVTARVRTYSTPEEAQEKIEKASGIYIWEWRKEKLPDSQVEASIGFLFSPEEKKYKEAYLAWIENGTTYYELIAKSDDIRGFREKEYLYDSVKEVAKSILAEL